MSPPEAGAAAVAAPWLEGGPEPGLEERLDPGLERVGELDTAEPPCSVERIATPRELSALRPEWDALLAASPSDHLFLTWEWLHTWWRHLSRGRRLAVLAVRRGGDLVALAPLATASPHPWCLLPASPLRLMGAGTVGSDYLDLIVRRGEEAGATEALLAYLGRARPVLDLPQLPAGRPAAAALAAGLEARGWELLERDTQVCPYIDLEGLTWKSYVAGLGTSHRQNLRRRLRKLEQGFTVRFDRARTAAEAERALDVLLVLHRRRWSGRGGSDAFTGPDVVAFHRELTRLALERGWLRFYVLSLDGWPAAALYGFLYRGRFLFYQAGFDPAFADYSVGLVTMGLTIREAIREGAREYDLLHGDEQYKFLWADRTRSLVRLELYPPSAYARLRRRGRTLVRRARTRVRGWLAGPAPAAGEGGGRRG